MFRSLLPVLLASAFAAGDGSLPAVLFPSTSWTSSRVPAKREGRPLDPAQARIVAAPLGKLLGIDPETVPELLRVVPLAAFHAPFGEARVVRLQGDDLDGTVLLWGGRAQFLSGGIDAGPIFESDDLQVPPVILASRLHGDTLEQDVVCRVERNGAGLDTPGHRALRLRPRGALDTLSARGPQDDAGCLWFLGFPGSPGVK